MKRFYKIATAGSKDDGGYAILLDGKPIRLPQGGALKAPNAALAGMVAAEWAAQTDEIDAETMPLTQIVSTAMRQDDSERAAIAETVLNYLDTDLLCYRAEQPENLARHQGATWDPWLAWFAEKSGVTLQTTTGLAALTQPRAAHDYVSAALGDADRQLFNGIQMATSISGSVVLGLAFALGAATPEEVLDAAQVEEIFRAKLYNEDFYGKDPQQEKTQNAMLRDLRALRAFIDTR